MSRPPFELSDAAGFPTVRQLSIFIENQVGQLLRVVRLFDETDVRILALSIVNSVDCAIIRMIVDDPDEAHNLLTENRVSLSVAELLVVSLPPSKRALLSVFTALLTGEVNILYTYPLLRHPFGRPAIALLTDDLEVASQVLRSKNFTVLDESELGGRPA